MTWRLAQSLVVLRGQIDAMYPNRSKVTDGTISGYAGSISSHNPNADGVVCALDITTGDYPGGISMAQSYALADAIRLELLAAPRGLYTYLIHHMEPPYVPSPGAYIAHGGPASLWQWIPYTGIDPHTSHIHVSVDWDIAAGEAASGQDPYDLTTPWHLATTSTQSGTITPIQSEEDELMAAKDELLARIAQVVAWEDEQFKALKAQADTNRNMLAGFVRDEVNGVPLGLLTAQFRKQDKSVTSVATAFSELLSKAAAPAPASPTVTVDVQALAAALVPLLPQGPTDLIAELRTQFNK
jgi:hypothetical protein